MDNVVRLRTPVLARAVPSTRTHFGQILRAINGIPVQIVSCSDRLSMGDLHVIADRLDHCARQVRALTDGDAA